MFWKLYLALFAFAGACTLIALVTRRSVVPLGLVSAGLWTILSLQARNITLYHMDGSSTPVGSEPWQYIALGLAIISLAMTVLYYWGVFPPEDDAAMAEDAVGDRRDHAINRQEVATDEF